MQAIIIMEFDNFWDLFDPDPEFNNRRRACRTLWENKSEQQRQAIMQFLQSGQQRSSRNPYYFLADFRIRRPQIMSFNDYYTKFGTTLERDGWHQENPTGNRVIYVKTT